MSTPHTPVKVVAHLRGGISYDPPFGLDLAGLLASRVRAIANATLDENGRLLNAPLPDSTGEEPDDYTLPLATCTIGPDWHWAATCASLDPPGEPPEMRIIARGTDAGYGAAAAHRPLPSISPARGPYRDARVPAPVTPAATASWWAVGDAAAIRALLTPIRAIGRRRNVGEGMVLSWHVEARPDVTNITRWTHLGETETLQRPCPPECAHASGVTDTRTVFYAIRPPSWNPDRLLPLAASADPDEW